ncbi:uncharacterized protein LOC126560984 [Anopheles maculipalpis]|uniref:uncharacterized protein LOC126560984 n=1 Tax=Anopheles maculipalpis TaxID=1496333 RepID=UPI002158E1CF|nr:uncharacterized protein LOC126560984 [Anopheles maculipalpis]
MAIRWTLRLVPVFALLISGGYGWFTYCSPEVDYFENIQSLLELATTRYGVYYSYSKNDTHPTVLQLLDRLNVDLTKQISAKHSIETYTADKLNHYGVSRTAASSVSEVHSLKEIFRVLDADNDLMLSELEHQRKEYVAKQQALNQLQDKIQALRGANVALEASIKARNDTLSKANATKTGLQKTMLERGLEQQ